MLSDSELEARRFDADRARMSYWEELVASGRGASHVMIERAARHRDAAGRAGVRITIRNVGAVVHHFFKYEATPAPLFMVFNSGPYDPKSLRFSVDRGVVHVGWRVALK